MYRLTAIAGPLRGQHFSLPTGEVTLGRTPENTFVIPSHKASRQHCKITVQGDSVRVEDMGSANGTFINGRLIRAAILNLRDRLSIGDSVFELAVEKARFPGMADSGLQSGSNPFMSGGHGGGAMGAAPAHDHSVTAADVTAPTDLWGRIAFMIESYVMPTVYKLNQTQEWRFLNICFLGVFVVASAVVSVSPLIEAHRSQLLQETLRRAKAIGHQLLERNTQALMEGADSRVDIGSAENEPGVQTVLITDLRSRIIAPAQKANQYFTEGFEAASARLAAKAFQEGRMEGLTRRDSDNLVVAIEPFKVFDSRVGRNVVSAMAIVSIDTSVVVPTIGQIGVVISETLIYTIALAAIFGWILYRLNQKPIEVLADELDRALRGEIQLVSREFKRQELGPLIDMVGSAIQRIPRDAASGGDGPKGPTIEDFLPALQGVGEAASFGMLVCDAGRRVAYLNHAFAELSGIRADAAMGQEITAVARDQALISFVQDAFDRVAMGTVQEDFEFSGVGFKVQVSALGQAGYVLTVMKPEEGAS